MAYFLDELLKCVTFVGYKDQDGEPHLAGSGFWISRSGPTDVEHMQRLAYFVTKAVWLKEFEEQKKSGLLFTDFKMEDLRLVRSSPSAATLVFRETIDGKQDVSRSFGISIAHLDTLNVMASGFLFCIRM